MREKRVQELEAKGFRVSDDPDEFLDDIGREKKSMSKRIQQWMMRYLRDRGWVVFWLDEEARKRARPSRMPSTSWKVFRLKLWQEEEYRRKKEEAK